MVVDSGTTSHISIKDGATYFVYTGEPSTEIFKVANTQAANEKRLLPYQLRPEARGNLPMQITLQFWVMARSRFDYHVHGADHKWMARSYYKPTSHTTCPKTSHHGFGYSNYHLWSTPTEQIPRRSLSSQSSRLKVKMIMVLLPPNNVIFMSRYGILMTNYKWKSLQIRLVVSQRHLSEGTSTSWY